MIKNRFPFAHATLSLIGSAILLLGYWLYLRVVPGPAVLAITEPYIGDGSRQIEWYYVHNPAVVDVSKSRRIRCFLNGKLILHSAFPEIFGETSATYLGLTTWDDTPWTLLVEDVMTGESVSTNFSSKNVLQLQIIPNPLRVILLDQRIHWL